MLCRRNSFDKSLDCTATFHRNFSKKLPEGGFQPDAGGTTVNNYASGWNPRNSARAGRGLPTAMLVWIG